MTRAQLDMFATQEDLFPAEPASYAPNPERVRRKLDAVLHELRRADAMPWDRKTRAFHQLVFPQMTNALPADEASQYRLEFQALIERLS
ncbi:hypothetical protein FHX15_000240 [Rhizobium sp. BK650]|uniref:hypothetical protein n=1 Tax=Rhizobium sp. BK650 TaxID=2586990 RepID=UPI00160FE8AE|nr:hypothetical protein [Rhizobium sp. BK650]MBB3655041.1 hypothetical protein [Rhizobium sp. BK650]